MQVLGQLFTLLSSTLFSDLITQVIVAAGTFALACAQMLHFLFPAS